MGEAAEERNYEQEAKQLGWVPQDEYRGDPDKWRDAKDFVEFGERILPILKSNNKKLHEVLGKTEAEVKQLRETMQQFAEHHKKTAEREYKKAEKEFDAKLKRIKSEQTAAAKDGDIAKFQELENTREELEANKPEKPEEAAVGTPPPEFVEWVAENTWYNDDAELREEADLIGQIYRVKHPRMGAKSIFDYVSKQVKKLHPEKFENPNRQDAADVGSGNVDGNSQKSKGRKSYSDLPEDAKRACNMFVDEGLMTKEEYIKEYFGAEV